MYDVQIRALRRVRGLSQTQSTVVIGEPTARQSRARHDSNVLTICLWAFKTSSLISGIAPRSCAAVPSIVRTGRRTFYRFSSSSGICDVWDEEEEESALVYGYADGVDFPEAHRFRVPEGCHWKDIRETPANVGAALSHAMRAIERANPDTLYRVFGAADWGNRETLTDEILKDLIEGLSEVSLGNSVASSDILGDAYEYVIGKFADITKRKKAGEFYTPRSVVRMMVDLLGPKGGRKHLRPGLRHGRHVARGDRARAALWR